MENNPQRRSRLKDLGFKVLRSKLIASTMIAFAISFGFHEVERHVDVRIQETQQVICQDIHNVNTEAITKVKVKLHCDETR